ncbi:hypothetical protein ACWDDN_25795 [Streptomyces griseoruber]
MGSLRVPRRRRQPHREEERLPLRAQRSRLTDIRNLIARIAEAERGGRLGEVEGLQVSLAGAHRRPHHCIDAAAPSLKIHARHEAELPMLQFMRSVFVFPTGERAETVASLDRHLPEQRDPWTLDGNLYINIDDEQTGYLFSDWDPEDVAILEAAIGHHPTWAVEIDISGRIDGTAEVHQMIALLLEHGGVAMDDYTTHPWTLPEILSGAVIDGLRFFDFRGYHELHREHGRF